MRFSLNFIKDLIELNIKPQQLAEVLTMSGMEVESLEAIGNDWVFDIEVTTNRYDWLSLIGIAREIAACQHKKFKLPQPKLIKTPGFKQPEIIIQDFKDCFFYVARVIKNVKVEASPDWLRQRVVNCGINQISNVVDLTNYAMLKWGNPLHAFDLDKLDGNIYVRRAKPNEIFVGIDDKERVLSKDNLVIADDKKVIALAGVIGAKNTAVDSQTKNVLLEAAIFNPLTVRCSRRLAGLDTESSYRFERLVHPDCLEFASQETINLLGTVCGGVFYGYQQAGQKPKIQRNKITLKSKAFNAYIGQQFSLKQIKTITANLGFELLKQTNTSLTMKAPAFRLDIKDTVDIYEEICRIYSYNKIDTCLPNLYQEKRQLKVSALGRLYQFKNQLRDCLSGLGLKEIITYSLESSQDLAKLNSAELIYLSNQMRSQENVLRPNLLLGALRVIRHNLNRNQAQLKLFELANVYQRDGLAISEQAALSLAVTGGNDDFYYLKWVVRELFLFLNQPDIEFREQSMPNFTNGLAVYLSKELIGYLGKLDENMRSECDLKEKVFYAEFSVVKLQKLIRQRLYQALNPYPITYRDISVALAVDKKFSDLEKIILDKGSNIIKITVEDIYKGKELTQQTIGLTVRVFYQAKDRTLTAQEVEQAHQQIRQALSEQAGITLR